MAAGLTPARDVVSQLSDATPDLITLAELLSLAIRIEPELLRAMRLRFLPGASAEIESDLYFSPLIAERSYDWCLFDPDVQSELRKRVSNRATSTPSERNRMVHARKLVERAHLEAPIGIIVEERILWEVAAGDADQIRRAVEIEMDQVLAHVLTKTSEGDALARWFANAAERLPAAARETEAYGSLTFYVSYLFGIYSPAPSVFPKTLLPSGTERVPLWAALRRDGLSLEPHPVEKYTQIAVPRTGPILLEVRSTGAPPSW